VKTSAVAFAVLLPLLSAGAHAECTESSIQVCFRPGETSCAEMVVEHIAAARSSLLVQAYDFTAKPIIQAIADAKKRGVDVRVLLDKENRQQRYAGGVTYLIESGIPVLIDDHVAIAHNKVIIIDGDLTIGGSYNYTASAENRNAENVTFIRSACVAQQFTENFERRWALSAPDERSLTAESLPWRKGATPDLSFPVRSNLRRNIPGFE
jgi:phosphatidylserine/phosphatidylglycerophosphate/cardiolipin synthase-like enzyme